MPGLRFNAQTMNPVVAGFDDLASSFMQAMNRRAERGYMREAEQRRRQNQLSDEAFGAVNEDTTDEDIAALPQELQAGAKAKRHALGQQRYSGDYKDVYSDLDRPMDMQVGDLTLPGRTSRSGAGIAGILSGGGSSLGEQRLDLAQSVADQRQTSQDYKDIVASIPRRKAQDVMQLNQATQQMEPSGRTQEIDDPDYQANLDAAMRAKMNELYGSSDPRDRALGRKILQVHGSRLADPFGELGVDQYRAWLSDDGTPGAAGGSPSSSIDGQPAGPAAAPTSTLSASRRARIELMLADPRTSRYLAPQQIAIWQRLLEGPQPHPAATPQAQTPPAADTGEPPPAPATPVEAAPESEPVTAPEEPGQVAPADVRAEQSTSPYLHPADLRAQAGPAPKLIDFAYDDPVQMANVAGENLQAMSAWMQQRDPQQAASLQQAYNKLRAALATNPKAAGRGLQQFNRALVMLAGQPYSGPPSFRGSQTPMDEISRARGY